MRSHHPEECATFFPDKPDAKVRHTAIRLAALEGTAGTGLEAEPAAKGGGGGGAADVPTIIQPVVAPFVHVALA